MGLADLKKRMLEEQELEAFLDLINEPEEYRFMFWELVKDPDAFDYFVRTYRETCRDATCGKSLCVRCAGMVK